MYFIILYNNNTSTLVSLQYGETTPLHEASVNGHKAVVEVLLQAGADHSIQNIVSMVQCILSFSLICFIILYKYTCVITVW